MNSSPHRGAPLVKLVVIALAIGVGIKLLVLAGVALLAGIEPARALMLPGLGVVLGALVFPFLRRDDRRS